MPGIDRVGTFGGVGSVCAERSELRSGANRQDQGGEEAWKALVPE
jgi:hypothetical protein